MSLPCELRIINALRKEDVLDDECIAYNPEKYPEFTLDEFREFTQEILGVDGGGWDNVHKFRDEDAYFETYNIPFIRDGEKFYLCVMCGQGLAWTLMTESNFQEKQKRLIENNYYRNEEDDNGDKEIGGEG